MMQSNTASGVRWGEWIGEGWQMFVDRWQVWVLQILILLLLFAIPVIPFYLMVVGMQIEAAQSGNPPQLPVMMIPLILVAAPLFLLGGAFILGGLWKTAFKQLRGEAISVGDLFSGGDVFLRILGAMVAVGFLAILGGLLCVFPALIVAGLLYFTIPLIVERDMSVGDAISASYEATKQHWFMFTLFAIVVAILASLGQYACGVGILATYPLQFTIAAVAYRDLFGVAGARSFSSRHATTPTSYAGQSWPVAPQHPAPSAAPQPTPVFSAQQPVEPVQPVTRCSQCGATLTRAANFCNFCGARLQL